MLATLIFFGLLLRLAKKASRLTRQSQRLESQIQEFAQTKRPVPAQASVTEQISPEEALSRRRATKRQLTKNKAERQRRLLKRLRNLKSVESE